MIYKGVIFDCVKTELSKYACTDMIGQIIYITFKDKTFFAGILDAVTYNGIIIVNGGKYHAYSFSEIKIIKGVDGSAAREDDERNELHKRKNLLDLMIG